MRVIGEDIKAALHLILPNVRISSLLAEIYG